MSNNPSTKVPPVPAVLLAGGASQRLGQPKQLLRLAQFNGETLLDRAVHLAQEPGADPVYVVLGALAEQIQHDAQLINCTVLLNLDWAEGMASSLRKGIRAVMEQLPKASAALLMVCDQPALSAEHLRQLLAIHYAEPEIVAASCYANRSGVPVVVPSKLFSALLELHGDQGARAVLQQAGLRVKEIDFPDGAWDIDSPEDLPRV